MFDYTYKTISSVEFRHPFFSDGRCKSFQFKPTAQCLNLMESNGLLFRQSQGRLFLLNRQAGNPLQPIIPLGAAPVLRFELFETSGFLQNISNYGGISKFYFSNVVPDGSVSNTLTRGPQLGVQDKLPFVTGSRLTFDIEAQAQASLLVQKIKPFTGPVKVLERPISIAEKSLEIVLSSGAGLYRLNWNNVTSGANVLPTLILVDDALQRSSAWGILDITLVDIPDQALHYNIDIVQDARKWKYYLMDIKGKLSDFGNGGAPLEIQYTPEGNLPAAVFQPKVQGALDSHELQVIQALKQADPRILAVYLFESDVGIPFFEQLRPKLSLVNFTSTQVLMDQLPLPAPYGSETTVFVNI